MFCNQCGRNNAVDAIFCDGCGVQIGEVDASRSQIQTEQKTSGKAFASLLFGVLSLFSLFFFGLILTLLFGVIGATIGFVEMNEESEYGSITTFAVSFNIVGIIVPLFVMIF